MANSIVKNTRRPKRYRRKRAIKGAGKQYVDKRIREVFPLDKYNLSHSTDASPNIQVTIVGCVAYDANASLGNIPGGSTEVHLPYWTKTYVDQSSYNINYWHLWCGTETRYNELENGNVFKLRRLKMLFDIYVADQVDREVYFNLVLVPHIAVVGTTPDTVSTYRVRDYIKKHEGTNFFEQHDAIEERTNQAGLMYVYRKRIMSTRYHSDVLRTGGVIAGTLKPKSICCDINLKSLSFMMRTNVSDTSHPGATNNTKYMFYGNDTTTPVVLVPYYTVKNMVVFKNSTYGAASSDFDGYIRHKAYVYSRQEKATNNSIV